MVHDYSFIMSISSSVRNIYIPDWTCNDYTYNYFDFSRFYCVESIEIGDCCFGSVKCFILERMNRLKHLKIGVNSFTQKKSDSGKDRSKVFRILDCQLLLTIDIGQFSFSDFSGVFELRKLPSLQSVSIGSFETLSCNFWASSVEIKGRDKFVNDSYKIFLTYVP